MSTAAERGEVLTKRPALVVAINNMAASGQALEALGAYYITGRCDCSPFGHGEGWGIVHVAGVELHLCGDCGRPTNRDSLLPAEPYAKGDVVVYVGMLWVLTGQPGPTGAVQAHPLDGDAADSLTLHVLQLNQED